MTVLRGGAGLGTPQGRLWPQAQSPGFLALWLQGSGNLHFSFWLPGGLKPLDCLPHAEWEID